MLENHLNHAQTTHVKLLWLLVHRTTVKFFLKASDMSSDRQDRFFEETLAAGDMAAQARSVSGPFRCINNNFITEQPVSFNDKTYYFPFLQQIRSKRNRQEESSTSIRPISS